jgi:hypothetical protein
MNQLDNYIQQLEEARREVQRADDDVRDASTRRLRAQRRIEALSQIVTGLQLLHAEQEDPQRERLPVGGDEATVRLKLTAYGHEGDEPRGKEAVRIIMSEAPRTWKASELVAEVLRRKWIDPEAKNPDAAVRVATARLHRDGLIERVGVGRYRYKFSDGTSSEPSARAAGELEAASEEGDEMPPPQT